MPKVVDIPRKRAEIMAAAAATFARHGYRGTNLSRVATAARMGKSSLYHYFPTKEALFTALADDTLRHEAEVFRSVVSASSPAPERLNHLLEVVTGLFAEWAKAGQLLVDFLREPRGRRRVRETLSAAREAITQLIRDGQRARVFRSGSPEALANVVLGALEGLFLQELVEPGVTRRAPTNAALAEMMMAALRREGTA